MLSEFLKDYLPIIIFLIIALGLSCAFVVINLILSPKHPDPEKLSAYECGFEPFEDSRMEFDVRFYLEVVKQIQSTNSDSRIIMLTGYGNIPTAVAAIKEGAIDYLAKPADAEDVEKALLADPA